MSLEYARFFVSFLLSDTKLRFSHFIWSSLKSHRRCLIISLVQLNPILVSWISRTLRHRIMRLVLVYACESALFWMVWARSNYLRSRVKRNQRVWPFDCSSRIHAVIGLYGYLRFEVGSILWSWSHFVLLLFWRKLSQHKSTLESPPNRILPLLFLTALSASFTSNYIIPHVHPDPFWSSAHIWP